MDNLKPAIDLIQKSEGLRLVAYPDPISGSEPYTIGWGHTNGVKEGDRITMSQAEGFLDQDILTFVAGVKRMVTAPITNNQLCALVDFVYNLGLGTLYHSHLLTYLNKGLDSVTVAEQFLLFNHAGGRVVDGLTQRRKAEARLFLLI